jgi:uncharacterized protein YdhG (YjbR/CyaY superfamily)
MQYEAHTPEEYLAKLENDWRKEKLEHIRAMILENEVDLLESIEYKMLAFGNGQENLFHLNAQSAYVSLYIGNIDKVDNGRELLKDFNLGKGCIRVKKKVNLGQTRLKEFIQKAIELWSHGGDVSC